MVDEKKECGACACGCSPEEVDEAAMIEQLDELLAEYKEKPGGLIPALQTTQRFMGYLPKDALMKISELMGKPYSEVTGVVSFYSFFSTVPRGKHMVRVCLGTACYVRGGKDVLAALKKEMGIDVGETTEDREFSLDVGRCFGACGLAPVIMVDDDVHQRVKPSKVKELLSAYKN
ncbi:MAG: NAD(P)H-dependent oxidoreductase subunit E [Victivallales bacterium]|nr:NAD(P)H-dependent oxidoreductase subunit E [Victivallales bacterium]